MKSILMSIKSKYVKEILNGNKTVEIRKKFPKDYVGWVYIYCTKDKKYANLINRGGFLTGMVVARFWCDKVEDFGSKYAYAMKDQHFYDILEGACLTVRDLTEYAHFTHEQLIKGKANLYAIHISNLEIFDKPKEISEFSVMREYTNCGRCPHALDFGCSSNGWCGTIKPLTRAPQSWEYIYE